MPLALSASAAAAAPEYPWCARYDWTTANCGFVSFQQCLATISGIGGRCEPNPRYVAPAAEAETLTVIPGSRPGVAPRNDAELHRPRFCL